MVALWEKLLFWKRQKKLKLNIDYEIYNFPDSDLSGIRLLKGKYRGVIYYYGVVKFSELSSMELGRLSFEFRIVESSTFTDEQLYSDDKFVIMLGDILAEMIVNETTGKNNIEEFD